MYPLFAEPTHMVVFDVAFKRETYFDGAFGVLVKVELFVFEMFYLMMIICRDRGRIQQNSRLSIHENQITKKIINPLLLSSFHFLLIFEEISNLNIALSGRHLFLSMLRVIFFTLTSRSRLARTLSRLLMISSVSLVFWFSNSLFSSNC